MRKDRLFFRRVQPFATPDSAGAREDIGAVRTWGASRTPILNQMVQVRQGLTDGKEHLVLIKFPREQLLEHINAGAGAADRISGLVQALIMMLDKISKPRM
tara:strand:+ start:2352 stop:2654 length:303 start_codon:yes stop_codon:yes gene_type:complete